MCTNSSATSVPHKAPKTRHITFACGSFPAQRLWISSRDVKPRLWSASPRNPYVGACCISSVELAFEVAASEIVAADQIGGVGKSEVE